MTYTNLHRLRLSTETGEVRSETSGEPQQHAAGYGDITDAEFATATPLTFAEFTALTQDKRYKSDPMDPRASEIFRRQCEAGLMKGEQQRAQWAERSASQMDNVEKVMSLNPGMPREIAEAAMRAGGYVNSEALVAGLKAAQASGSANDMTMHEAKVTISHLLDSEGQ